MKYSTFVTSTLLSLLPLVTKVSAWCDAVNTNTYSTCKTKYGDKPVTSTKYSTRTIHTGVTTTVTYTNPPITDYATITKPDTTITDEVTSTCTISEYCQVYTVSVTTTETATVTISDVETKCVWTTTKVYGPVVTIPAPYGFVGVREDPDYKYKKRNENPPGEYQYPRVIACTTTFLRTCTISTTVGPYTITETKTEPGETYTTTETDVVKTTVCENPTVTTTTVPTTTTVTTHTTTCTTVTKTKTINIPGPTKYAACKQEKNILSGVKPKDFDGGIKCSADSAYDCCVECIKNPNCAGSYFVDGGYKGDRCYLKLSYQCYGQSQSLKFEKKSYGGGSISNGKCGKWKPKNKYH